MGTLVVVPDASVILKWVLPPATESDVRHALALRDAIATGSVRALVPTLWIYEIGNLLARKRPGEASRLLDVLVRFGLADAPRSPAWLGSGYEKHSALPEIGMDDPVSRADELAPVHYWSASRAPPKEHELPLRR